MGYRSEVAYAIRMNPLDPDGEYNKGEKKLDEDAIWSMFVTELKAKMHHAKEDLDSGVLQIMDSTKTVSFHVYDVKWYPEYEDVEEHHSFLEIAHSYNETYEQIHNIVDLFSTAFIRIGEEEDDIETNYVGDGYELIGVHRSIDINHERRNA